MVSRNYTVQSDKRTTYQDRSPKGSCGKGIHRSGNNAINTPKRRENIYHKHNVSVGTQYNSQRYKEIDSPTNSRYTYSTPHPKCKVDRQLATTAVNPTYSTIDHDNYNNINVKRATNLSESSEVHETNNLSADVQSINCVDPYYQYASNVTSFNSFNNTADSYTSQGFKVRIPLTNSIPVNNNCGNSLPTIAESVVDETEYPIEAQQDYEYRSNDQKNNNEHIRECAVDVNEECYCKDTPYGQRTERFQYITENSRENDQNQKKNNKNKYQGTHPDSLYRVAQLVGHDGSHNGNWFSRTSRLRNLYRLLRWPLTLVAAIIALILIIYFLMPETKPILVPTFSNNSADWDSQRSENKGPDSTIIPSDNTTKIDDNNSTKAMMNDTTTKRPFEIIVESEKDELNFGYPEDDTREDEGVESILKLGPGLGLDPHIFQHVPTTLEPIYPKNLSPSVQYGNEHEDAASNEKRFHQTSTADYDSKYYTPTYAIFVNRAALRPTTERSNEENERIEPRPEISGPNINKVLKAAPLFTSGHQNSFGIPVEDAVKSTTQSSLYHTRVSPTLPTMVGRDYVRSTTARSRWNTTEDGICFSTRLSMCRGVLPYDLTTIPLVGGAKLLEATPLLQLLLRSGCSPRARQFLCSLLEPECRPRGMKVLAPCKTACEEISTSCRDVIAAASTELAAVFDCSQYPVEEDECAPLKTSGVIKSVTCPSGELKCPLDGTCIPAHWRCDGISDCAGGTDEQGCDDSSCAPNEFKCGNNGTCIPEEWVCDGHVDCLPEGFDEHGCASDGEVGSDTGDVQGAASQHPRPVKLPRPPRLQITTQKSGVTNEVIRPTTEYDNSKELLMMSDSVLPVRKPLSTLRKKALNPVSTSSRIVTSTSSSISIHRSTLCAPGDASCKRKILSSRLTPCARGSCSETRKPTSVTTTPQPTFNVTQKIEDMEAASGLTSHSSPCPQGELRCVDGRCITLDQLCDRQIDCSDGVDEANCFT